jgi:hypothetical protein
MAAQLYAGAVAPMDEGWKDHTNVYIAITAKAARARASGCDRKREACHAL